MAPRKLTDDEYDKLLWENVWEKAKNAAKKNWNDTAIVQYLSVETEVSEATIWRCISGKQGSIRSGTRQQFVKYAGYKTYDEFKEYINQEQRKKGDVHWRIIEVIGDDPFLNDIYRSLSAHSFLASGPDSKEKISTDEADLFFRFIKSLHLTYSSESIFTSLNIVADQHCSMGKLLMKDYFIQLSYITQAEIKTVESIIRNETELNKIKIRRSIENNQQLTKDYIVNFSLHNIQNLLVLGNPGVGKSTFGRWLCHLWSQNPTIVDNVIPVYIQLKGLEFGSNENAITNYVHRNYLIGNSSETKDLHSVLRKIPSFVCFILDGYDELSEAQKEKLFYQLQEISSNCKYILTSRPYGILNTYGLKWDQLIQLDGFDTSNINNYIDVFLQKRNISNGKNKEELIDIIHLNPTLTDFAHNPLMLSFIVYIYLSDDNAHDTFKKIQTRFDLQQTVISWMFAHNKLKIATKLDKQLIEAASKIASEMELDKTPEKRGNPSDEEVQSALIPLSQLGIGQYVERDMFSYKFYFNSITFQEYFASIEIAKKITSAGLEYILQDSYFWNLTAMVIGQLNNASTYQIMDSLLATCEEELVKEEKDYSYYKYVLLLSECRTDYLNNKLNHKALQTINRAFARNNKNERLKYSVAECVQRIYNKANDAHQKTFKAILLESLEISWANPSDKLLKYDSSCKHFPTLVKYLDLNLDYGFTQKCIDLLIRALEELKADIADFSAAWDSPDFILTMIQDNDDHFFQTGRPYLEKAIPLLPMYFVNYRGKIQLHYTNAKAALLNLKENIYLYNDKIEKLEKEDLIGEIAVYEFILGKKNKELTNAKDAAECQLALSNAAGIIHEYLKVRGADYSIGYVDGPRPIAQLATEGLFESKEYLQNYPKGISILAAIDDEYLFFDQIIQFHLYNYFEEIVNKTSLAPTDDGLREICTMIYCIPALKNKIAFHRDKIFDLANRYIDNNSDAFQGTRSVSKLDYFLRLLERGEDAVNESDRRFFIENMIRHDKAEFPYLKNIFLPKVISRYIILYDPVYWNFILSCLDENDENSIRTALLMYSNTSIYQYTTNLQYVQKLLSFLTGLQTKSFYSTFITAQAEAIIAIISQVLLMLKQTSMVSSQTRGQIISLTEELLRQDLLKREIKDHLDKDRRLGIGNAAYILQYYFTNDLAFNLKINYWQELEKNNQRKMLVEYIYSGFVQHGELQEKEINKIKEVTGPEFIMELYKYHEQMKVYHFPFVKEQFASLCSIKSSQII